MRRDVPRNSGSQADFGGGGASAPTTQHEPMRAPGDGSTGFAIAPGTRDSAWPDPDYTKLPCRRKIEWTERYVDELGNEGRYESVGSYRAIINYLHNYTTGQELDEQGLENALKALGEECTHQDLWLRAKAPNTATVRGGSTRRLSVGDAQAILRKMRGTLG